MFTEDIIVIIIIIIVVVRCNFELHSDQFGLSVFTEEIIVIDIIIVIIVITVIIVKIVIIVIIIRCHLELELHSDQFGFSVFTEEMNFELTKACTRDYYQFGRFHLMPLMIMMSLMTLTMI